MVWGLRSGATVVAVVALIGGYLAADAYDAVPGMLTTAEPWPAPAPFPDAPGAVDGPDVAPLLAGLSPEAPVPSEAEIASLVAQVAADPRLGSRVGVVVADALTGETLGETGQDQFMVPASTQKVLTAVAALSSPIADRTLPTRVVFDGDTLYLVGGGDMMLASGAGNPSAINGRAGLADLADQVAGTLNLTGQTTVRLALDETLFTGAVYAPSIDPANIAAGYIAPVAALGVNVGLLQADYSDDGQRASDPGMAAAQAFVERLAERGVTVEGNVVKTKAPSTGAQELGMVESAPVPEVVEFFLHNSDNTITEVVGRLVALEAGLPGTGDGATQAVVAAVARLGIDLTGAALADCSGLGAGSRLTAAQLASILDLLVDPAFPALRSVAVGMPVAGLNGTLANRFTGDNAGRGVVRAKTGSLPNVTSLAGTVMTGDDRQLVFVVMADQYTANPLDARAAVDQFVGRLAALSTAA
ncbi:D-alanyl-D-alanine carboxypeptidase/D-alanyl-D-alanine-endopeptidase [Antribacter sp. KLBMP9083]|uniref:D-alanyl-D-alanine carboxypeptidase/D-alanyl-D-alanine-endopeptidase n=1 Tax=Antribacter soli TaxID=2910976 RepID=A0AA41UA02_9MICO|nr:D-alanyl-D-alanine carboxypeptidase/D-alanyl-D-alanine-endopeptidase [Antribacter soli]MCF4122132.1 D-alanyl-D-alanine carboxypeptidase/D-alanyl-D-alanine-endopeptidase [Antribacter soli]